MIPRYSRPEMAVSGNRRNRYRIWLEVEILACEANARRGLIPARALATIKKKPVSGSSGSTLLKRS